MERFDSPTIGGVPLAVDSDPLVAEIFALPRIGVKIKLSLLSLSSTELIFLLSPRVVSTGVTVGLARSSETGVNRSAPSGVDCEKSAGIEDPILTANNPNRITATNSDFDRILKYLPNLFILIPISIQAIHKAGDLWNFAC